MSYYVKGNGKKFDIIEKDTELTIISKTNEREANKLCRSLNLGAGFNGFTPNFFCYEYKGISN